ERVVIPGNQLLAEYLDRCVARGALRPLDTFVAARALVGCLVMFLISQSVLGGDALRPISDAAVIETVTELFLRGALPRE
ncbi:MAG TPA: TetR/AcrR family transcriptional regulator C-terminal domain-containing protein, partial [Myxococcota bacterium]|nr:TetR/AcrR family transcriptional regulator C-terminal domain-containing protein [Myxococcota bacterium]